MAKLEYDAVDADDENERRKQVTDGVDDVLDVAHLGPWEMHRDNGASKQLVFNNTMADERPPLILRIKDDDVVKLLTTAYGEPKVVAGQHRMARKALPRGESAFEWVTEHFDLE